MLKIINKDNVGKSKIYTIKEKIRDKVELTENELDLLYKIKNPTLIHFYARYCNNDLEIKKCENTLTVPYWAYYFAFYVPGANIEKCQEIACKDPHFACKFALDIAGANIDVCKKAYYKK